MPGSHRWGCEMVTRVTSGDINDDWIAEEEEEAAARFAEFEQLRDRVSQWLAEEFSAKLETAVFRSEDASEIRRAFILAGEIPMLQIEAFELKQRSLAEFLRPIRERIEGDLGSELLYLLNRVYGAVPSVRDDGLEDINDLKKRIDVLGQAFQPWIERRNKHRENRTVGPG